ncbi:LOW QUALITY PROTEIN: ras-related protein Rab-18-B-like [Sylvia borin]
MEPAGLTLKLLMVGDSGVGKSSLLRRFTDGAFEPRLKPTVGEPGSAGAGACGLRSGADAGGGRRRLPGQAFGSSCPASPSSALGIDFKVKRMVLRGRAVQLAIWDTAGQERFRTLTPSYYRGAQGVVLVYDVTRKDTFTGVGKWLHEVEMHTTNSSTVKMLVGNKTDKPDREVERKEGLQLARKHSLLFIETSAKTEDGVQQAFEELVIKILQTPCVWEKSTFRKLQLMDSSAQQNKGLCSGHCLLI